MALQIDTFRHDGARHFGTSLFKALGHPVSAPKARALVAEMAARGKVAVLDVDNGSAHFDTFYDLSHCAVAGVFTQHAEDVGRTILGAAVESVTEIGRAGAATIFVAAFDAKRTIERLRVLVGDTPIRSFDDIRLPDSWLSNPRRYTDPLNFATNFAFLRESGGHHTALRTANYWSGYGATDPGLWLCLFDETGVELATWNEPLPPAGGTLTIDSREVRARFGLPEFTGSLFVHALRIKGHEVVKYALDTYGEDATVLSATHDANAWPADFYAGLPAPARGERVTLWVQNAHPMKIPANEIALGVMGGRKSVAFPVAVPPFGTVALDAGALLPGVKWPAQLEVTAGRYFVRPRYEIERRGRTRMAHANVERIDLLPDPQIPRLEPLLGKGFILPMPLLPVARYRTTVLPTPMARGQKDMPIAVIVADVRGREVTRKFLGKLARGHRTLIDADELLAGAGLEHGYGHMELVYDFQDGGGADGWLHAIARYEDRETGHIAETSFGAHMFNALTIYKDEPQSYTGAPPGLSTRLFLRLGPEPLETMCHLTYPASRQWHAHSDTTLQLIAADGREVASEHVSIACGGSLLWRYSEVFNAPTRAKAGAGASVLIRDSTCRLFGYHGLVSAKAFSLDHMFGF